MDQLESIVVSSSGATSLLVNSSKEGSQMAPPSFFRKKGIKKPVTLGKGGEFIDLLSRLVSVPPVPSAAASQRPATPEISPSVGKAADRLHGRMIMSHL
jgi:hypothetical protein